jgi:predicted ATPase/class 3 adenylate cyclase/predicted negative regulator of RcsB-dependent stress response
VTYALLLTDLVDSTALSEQLGDARMADVWAAHDGLSRDLLPAHRGREIDKSDGLLLLFDAVSDAVAYALAYHAALRALSGRLDVSLAARAGIHVGPVILRENPAEHVARGAKPLEVDGLAKPVAARVMAVALGGQTLLSESARAALGETSHRVACHGHWRVKGVSEPIELFEIGDDGAPFTPPPDGAKVYRVVRDGAHWVPVRHVRHSLPRERDAFVGRGADLKGLARLLDGGAHLVSVLGIGGTGKTRLATHYGWTWLGEYPGGVWFCDLSEARGIEGIVYAVARALDVPLGKDDPVVQLGHAIAARGRCLVILDNFEQVARHAGDTLGGWLDRAHEAAFVVTTREVLGLAGETALALAPLRASDGFDLFVARALQAKRDFKPDEPGAIEALVKLLDGLPLAIELAAARVRLMPPKTLLARMSQRFKLLASTGGRHTRQATMRGALDWSWDLLAPDEQQALAQLSVFEGGFTLTAAEAVLALDDPWPVDAVQGLVDKSLVRCSTEDRFDLLVTVQEYGSERLDARGGRAQAESRHGAHFASHGADEALESLDVHGGVARWRALVGELDNLVIACRRAIARGDGDIAVANARAAYEVLDATGPPSVAVDLAEAVAHLPTPSPWARRHVARLRGLALRMAGRGSEALAHYDAAIALGREAGDRGFEGVTLRALGLLHLEQGRVDEALAHYSASLAIHREMGDRRFEGMTLCNLGVPHIVQGRMDEALAHFDAALAVAREVGNRRSEGLLLGNLAILHTQQGRIDAAFAHYDAALVIQREVGNRRFEGMTLGNLGILHAQHGRIDEALTHYNAALAIHREVGNRRSEAITLCSLGELDMGRGRLDAAHAHLDDALTVARELGDRRTQGCALGMLGLLHDAQGRIDEARRDFEAGAVLLRAMGDRVQLGRVLCGRASLEQRHGRPDDARAALAEAEALAQAAGAGPASALGQALAAVRDELAAAQRR